MTQVEMNYSLISATIPCLKPFLRACNSGFLGSTLTRQYGSTYTSGGSYALQSMSSDKAAAANHQRRKSSRPAQAETSTVVTHPPPSSRREDAESVESGGSEQLIIRQTREWIVEHRYEDREAGDDHGIVREG